MPDIAPHHLALVKTILKTYRPTSASLWLFGSRATPHAKPYSDIDLAIDLNGAPLPLSLLSILQHAFEESDLPYKVDIVDFNAISTEFKNCINKTKIHLP